MQVKVPLSKAKEILFRDKISTIRVNIFIDRSIILIMADDGQV